MSKITDLYVVVGIKTAFISVTINIAEESLNKKYCLTLLILMSISVLHLTVVLFFDKIMILSKYINK